MLQLVEPGVKLLDVDGDGHGLEVGQIASGLGRAHPDLNLVGALGGALLDGDLAGIGGDAEVSAGLLAGGGVLSQADTSGSTAGLREATIGRYRGFDVVVNPFDTEEKPRAIGLLPEALAYVSQIEKIEAMRADATFADRIRGLHVYGSKVIRPLAVQIYTGL